MWSLKLFKEEITQSLRHGVPAGPEGETVHLNRKHTHSYTGYMMVHYRDDSVCLCVCVGAHLYLCLCVGLQSEEAAHLSVLGVNDTSSNKVCRIGIHLVQQSYTKT